MRKPVRKVTSSKNPPVKSPAVRGRGASSGRAAPPADGRWRLEAVVAMFMVGFVILAIRSVDLAVFQGPKLKKRASNQHQRRVTIPAGRGVIRDRHGRALAVSLPVQSLSFERDRVADVDKLSAALAPLLGKEKKELVERIGQARAGSFPVLKRKLSPDVVRQIERLNHPALFFTDETERFYPYGEVAAHLIGFVGVDGRGLEGLEHTFERYLQGLEGEKVITRDRLGGVVPGGHIISEAVSGGEVTLTIDATIQYIAYRALLKWVGQSNAHSGTVVVMNPQNGELLAMASVPSFNPNNLGSSSADARRNRVVMDLFEPGSTFKIFTIAAGIESGIISPDTVFNTENGVYRLRNATIHDSSRQAQLTVAGIMQKSSNIGAAKIGLLLGRERQEDFIYAFGFGRPTGIALEYEGDGQVVDVRFFETVGVANRSFGYGVTATPLQLVTAISAAVNGGRLNTPLIIKKREKNGHVEEEMIPRPERVISERTSRLLREMMVGVVTPEGTAPQAAVEGYAVGGKTGTARKIAKSGRGYADHRYFSSFTGFAPASKPSIVIYVGIDEPQGKYYGGVVAAPVFREIAREVLPLLGILPEGEERPRLPPAWQAEDPARPLTLAQALPELLEQGIVPRLDGAGPVARREEKDDDVTLVLK